jgi:hypothetical protein
VKVLEVPSEVMCNVETGHLFTYIPTGKVYVLLHRDIVRCYIRRWTWWDDLKLDIRRKYSEWKGISNNGRERA